MSALSVGVSTTVSTFLIGKGATGETRWTGMEKSFTGASRAEPDFQIFASNRLVEHAEYIVAWSLLLRTRDYLPRFSSHNGPYPSHTQCSSLPRHPPVLIRVEIRPSGPHRA